MENNLQQKPKVVLVEEKADPNSISIDKTLNFKSTLNNSNNRIKPSIKKTSYQISKTTWNSIVSSTIFKLSIFEFLLAIIVIFVSIFVNLLLGLAVFGIGNTFVLVWILCAAYNFLKISSIKKLMEIELMEKNNNNLNKQ